MDEGTPFDGLATSALLPERPRFRDSRGMFLERSMGQSPPSFLPYLDQSFAELVHPRSRDWHFPARTAKLGISMNYGLFGGSFDPVHNGHVEIVREALRSGLEQVVVMPCLISPHKQIGSPADMHASVEHRWNMLQLAFGADENTTLSRHELEGTPPSYTFHTIAHLEKQRPKDHLTLILGLDQFIMLDQWAGYPDWTSRVRFLVFNRGEGQGQVIPEKYHYMDVTFMEKKVSPLSSTFIRTQIREGQRIDSMVPPKVNAYIQDHDLYRS